MTEKLRSLTEYQFAVALGASIATIVLAFWYSISSALVTAGQTEELLILVATVSMGWVCLDLIQYHLDEDQLEQWALKLSFVTERDQNER